MIPNIKVIGVGGSGSNTIARMNKFHMAGVELWSINTDVQALRLSPVKNTILIGREITKGLGAGMNMEIGRLAAEESASDIIKALVGANMVFITCGCGGGTGSGAAPVIARLARDMGILTVAVVTTPFFFEGEERRKIAHKSIEILQNVTDSLMVIANDNLLKVIDETTTVSDAFMRCDEILHQAVQSVTDLIVAPGIINLDFASILSIMKSAGRTLFGVGIAQGEHRAVEAAHIAMNSPLLDFSIAGSKGVLFNISGHDVTLHEIKEAARIITEKVDPKAQILFGATKDLNLKKGEIKITLIATKL